MFHSNRTHARPAERHSSDLRISRNTSRLMRMNLSSCALRNSHPREVIRILSARVISRRRDTAHMSRLVCTRREAWHQIRSCKSTTESCPMVTSVPQAIIIRMPKETITRHILISTETAVRTTSHINPGSAVLKTMLMISLKTQSARE